ncbi:MAG: hypothetical protein JWO03_1815 [Bacteroidetes bacterium]|nr:hypothetical protein [Bacteroidota bacterium]
MTKFIRFAICFLFAAGMTAYIVGCNVADSKVMLDVAAKPFELLSQYHFFKGTMHDLKPNDRITPYDLNSPLFSDYAHKARFVYMPDGKVTEYQEDKVLQLPVGACLIKNFYYPADFRKPDENKRIMETRLLVHRPDGWEGVEYIWNDEQTDAHLEVAGDIKKVSWIHNDGSKKEADYIIPSKNQCKSCHWLNGAITPIGPKVRNLNKDFTYGDGKNNQLAQWTKIGILKGTSDIKTAAYEVNYNDEHADLNDRARAYLDANCAHCHNPGGPAYTSGLYLNYDMKDMEHIGVCKTPVSAGRGTGNFLVDIVPGDPAHSIMPFRMASTDAGIKMPELGRSMVHQEGVDLITKWIASLPGGPCKPN